MGCQKPWGPGVFVRLGDDPFESSSLRRILLSHLGDHLMSIAQSICAAFLLAVVTLLGIKPEPSVAVSLVSIVAMFVFVTWLEKRQDTELDQLTAQVKDLKNKVEMLLLNKGFGR